MQVTMAGVQPNPAIALQLLLLHCVNLPCRPGSACKADAYCTGRSADCPRNKPKNQAGYCPW